MSKDAFSMANDWLSFQQKYWESLGSLNPDPATENKATQQPFNFAANPWSDALQNWWKSSSGDAEPSVRNFYTQIVEQGKSYFQMAEYLSHAMQSSQATQQSATQWQEVLNNTMKAMKEAFTSSPQEGQEVMRKMMGMSELPLDHWQRIAASMSFMPGDFLQGLNTIDPGRMNETIRGHLDQFASVPGIGHMRERQSQFQELYRKLGNYQSALQDYIQVHNEIGLKSIARMQSCLGNLDKEGRQLDSMRSIYDLWVDCCEDVYAESVTADEYIEIYGNIVNALMELKQHGRMMFDETLGALNMPTRQEFNTLHDRFHQEWRENKKMRAELEALKEQIAGSTPKPVARRKATTRTGAATTKKSPAAKTKAAQKTTK